MARVKAPKFKATKKIELIFFEPIGNRHVIILFTDRIQELNYLNLSVAYINWTVLSLLITDLYNKFHHRANIADNRTPTGMAKQDKRFYSAKIFIYLYIY